MKELSEIRSEIDRVDREIVGLLNRRAELSLEAARVKAASGLERRDPAREREVEDRAVDIGNGPLSPEALRTLFQAIIKACLDIRT